LLESCKTEVAIAILGQNLTTEVKGGLYAAAESHMAVRQDIIYGDKKLVEDTFNELINGFSILISALENCLYFLCGKRTT
jgi:phage gp29-like protein